MASPRIMTQDQLDNARSLVREIYTKNHMTSKEIIERVEAGLSVERAASQESVPVERAADTETYEVATDVVGINLEPLAKLIYAELHPMVDDTPRLAPEGPMPGTFAQWRAIKRLNTNRVHIGVAEGSRNEAFEVEAAKYNAPYKTLGMETGVTEEAQWSGQGFDDVRALAALQLVQASKIQEEDVMLGGNASVLLGQPDAPTLVDVPLEGNIPTATDVFVYVLPLTHMGMAMQNGLIDQPVLGQVTRIGADGRTSVFGGFSGAISPVATITTGGGAGHAVSAAVPYIVGVQAWAWYVGTVAGAANAILYAITTINSILIVDELGTGVQAADDATIQADNSVSDLIYDGRLSIYNGAGLEVPAPAESGAFRHVMADGVAGEGTPLSVDPDGGIVEFNQAFRFFWNQMRLCPDKIYCSAEGAEDVAKLVLTGATNVRLNADIVEGSNTNLNSGVAITEVTNKILKRKVALVVHPTIGAGTFMFETLRLPVAAYPNSRVNSIHSIKLRSGYRQREWPETTREYRSGMYHSGVLADYAPAAGGYIVNVGRA